MRETRQLKGSIGKGPIRATCCFVGCACQKLKKDAQGDFLAALLVAEQSPLVTGPLRREAVELYPAAVKTRIWRYAGTGPD